MVRSRARSAGAVVVVGEALVLEDAFGLEPRSLGTDDLSANCDEPVADGLTIRAPFAAAVRRRGLLRQTATRWPCTGRPRTGSSGCSWPPDVLSNDHVTEADNAALSLRLLGQHPRLVWYVADPTDVSAGDGVSISSLLPRWLYPALWLLLLGTLTVLLWRGRRFGPLVREPMPVVVRAAESTESRGRLYHRARDRGHAATILRHATQRRLAEHLALRPEAPMPEIVRAVAARTGRRTERGPRPARTGHRHERLRVGRPRPSAPATGRRGTPPMTETLHENEHRAGEAREALSAVRAEVAKAVVGQDAAVSGLLVALLSGGHVLMEGVPGVAKTLLVRTLATALAVDTKRVQFTPDLMPGDITGSMVIEGGGTDLTFREGPLFTNLLLADEINRTPPKTQSALLEAMEEGQVSADGVTRPLPTPFLVAATQNPVEYEGTYPLPEAQLDRFLLKVQMPLPGKDDEVAIVRRHADGFDPRDIAGAGVTRVATAGHVAAGRAAVGTVRVSDEIASYIVDIARATRTSPSLGLGVSPRGATALLRTSRAWAWLSGRDFVTPDDVKSLAQATLAHRLALRPEAELEGVAVNQVLATALGSVTVPR